MVKEERMTGMARRIGGDEGGQDAVEYTIVVGLIALACLAALSLMGSSFDGVWRSVATTIDAAASRI
jgi:Flp pilus assembly pilin Flp